MYYTLSCWWKKIITDLEIKGKQKEDKSLLLNIHGTNVGFVRVCV